MTNKATAKVNVEMTESEKEEFVALQAKKKSDAEGRAALPEVSIDLNFRHEINNVKYGPGIVTAKSDVAQTLESQDQAATLSRMKETIHSKTDLEIIGKGMSRIVGKSAVRTSR